MCAVPILRLRCATCLPMSACLFLLRDVEGYAPAAIARLLDIPEAQVQRACFSARIRLCQVLAEQARTEAA